MNITSINLSQYIPSFSNFISDLSETNKKIAIFAVALFALVAAAAVTYKFCWNKDSKVDAADKDGKKIEKKEEVKDEKKAEKKG
jgi:hypothetical protein